MVVNTFASLALLGLAAASPMVKRAAPIDELVGFGAGTTGGGTGAGTTVTSCAQLETAVEKGGVIRVSGTLKDCGTLKLVSDTSLLGVGANSGFSGTGFRARKISNVIIRNLNFDTPEKKGDIIDIDASTKIWVDHNNIHSIGLVGGKDDYDGLLDVKHGSDLVTISWNKFHDHWKGSLVGHSDNNAGEDTGKLHVTYHHNSFTDVNSRLPSIRFGTGHIYSSCYNGTPTSGINSRMGAKVLVEETYFKDTALAIVTDLDSDEEGFATSKNNVLAGSSATRITQEGAPAISYKYTTDPAASVCAIIEASAGPGVVKV